jgi:hypothetical protein
MIKIGIWDLKDLLVVLGFEIWDFLIDSSKELNMLSFIKKQ